MKNSGDILVINPGSSSLKLKIFSAPALCEVISGTIQNIGAPQTMLELYEPVSGRLIAKNYPAGLKTHVAALQALFQGIEHRLTAITAVGYRVVHGGTIFTKPTVVTDTMLSQLAGLSSLAPLHNPAALAMIRAGRRKFRRANHVAVFDTAFFSTLPAERQLYALPPAYGEDLGIRRYGFHGISHQAAARAAVKKLQRPLAGFKVITCHLGSGCSIAAIRSGRAVDTTMGFTPLEGVMMATRSGTIDPSIPLFLMRVAKLSARAVESLLNTGSGWLGVFGKSADMREVLIAAGVQVPNYHSTAHYTGADRARARLALEMFIASVSRHVASMIPGLGGVDAVVFTGSIGERSQFLRSKIVAQLKPVIGRARVIAVPADEALAIAQLIISGSRRTS